VLPNSQAIPWLSIKIKKPIPNLQDNKAKLNQMIRCPTMVAKQQPSLIIISEIGSMDQYTPLGSTKMVFNSFF